MKKIICLLLFSKFLYSQSISVKEDIKTPTSGSSMTSKANINESTGKVSETLPIATLKCRAISYEVIFNYDGSNVFKQAKYQNRYIPTSILGVGWSMAYPRITADTKETASRDDDSFYLNNSELICIKRPSPVLSTPGDQVWEFKTKVKSQNIIKYYEFRKQYNSSGLITIALDYWEVIDDKGRIYKYGNTENSRDLLLSWGNWIGDSKNVVGAQQHTSAWNLASISDQWNNEISFLYQKIEQPLISSNNLKQTEATYLKQVTSGTGEKIIFTYSSKDSFEYYEPNTEMSEPDAYQEKYEKLYLSDLEIFNSSNELLKRIELDYDTQTASGLDNRKRYLTTVTNVNAFGNSLPSQKFEYYTSGTFAGALKRKTNPTGGSVTYEYDNKYIFNNNNLTLNNGLNYQNHTDNLYARYHCDNYSLEMWSSNFDFSNIADNANPMVPFFIDRKDWDGRKWVKSRFYIPENVRCFARFPWTYYMDNIKFVFGDDYYAMLIYNRETKKGNIYLWHKLSDGTWNYSTASNLDTGGKDNNDFSEDPELLATKDFIAVGTYRSGKIYTYSWNNLYWINRTIIQNVGQYSYAANNNFIISMDLTSGADMPTVDYTSNASHYDKYYIHYLNAEKKWQTKSWTNLATANLANIDKKSKFYPNNSMTSFVANNNQEALLKWDKNYNLTNVDQIVTFDDNFPFLGIGGNIFSAVKMGWGVRSKVFKAVAISGANNIVSPDLNIETEQGFSYNRILGLRVNGGQGGAYAHEYRYFDPNFNTWLSQDLMFVNKPLNQNYLSSYALTTDFFVAGLHAYKINNFGNFNNGLITNHNYPGFVANGGDYIYATYNSPPNFDPTNSGQYVGESRYLYIDKVDGSLKNILLTNKFVNYNFQKNANHMGDQFGGKFPLFSRKNLNGRRLIDNQIGNNIYDVVVSRSILNNGENGLIYTNYTYENSNTLSDDVNVIYGMVKIEEKGSGLSSNGYIKKYYNNGAADKSMAGLLNKVEIYTRSSRKIKEIINTYTKSHLPLYNSVFGMLPIHYYTDIKNTKVVENLIFLSNEPASKIIIDPNIPISSSFGTGVFSRVTDFVYDQRGYLIQSQIVNSGGKIEKMNFSYADDHYPFVKSKNIMGILFSKLNRVDNTIISSERINWVQSGTNAYVSSSISGPDVTKMRLNNEIRVVDNKGNIVETSDGRGLVTSVLMGYNYKYPVATIRNSKFTDGVAALEIDYQALQLLTGVALQTELTKLYNNLPHNVMIDLSIYNNDGEIEKTIDSRENELNYTYDEFSRVKYVTDKFSKLIKINNYHYKN